MFALIAINVFIFRKLVKDFSSFVIHVLQFCKINLDIFMVCTFCRKIFCKFNTLYIKPWLFTRVKILLDYKSKGFLGPRYRKSHYSYYNYVNIVRLLILHSESVVHHVVGWYLYMDSPVYCRTLMDCRHCCYWPCLQFRSSWISSLVRPSSSVTKSSESNSRSSLSLPNSQCSVLGL